MSLVGVVWLPHPPLLLAETDWAAATPAARGPAAGSVGVSVGAGSVGAGSVGALDVGESLRAACVDALGAALSQTRPDVVLLVTGRDDPARAGRGRSTIDPLGLRVGRRLLREWADRAPQTRAVPAQEVVTVPRAASPAQVARASAEVVARCAGPARILLVALADGSARRDAQSPGLPDPDARAFDEALLSGVRGGDAPALARLEAAGRDAELLIAGRASVQVVGAAVEQLPVAVRPQSARLHDDLGVAYVVGRWACESC